MEIAVGLVLALVAAGATLGRWTRWNPLSIATVLGLVMMVPAFLMFASFMSPAALPAAIALGTVAAAPAAFGAFMGWLRRRSVERIG